MNKLGFSIAIGLAVLGASLYVSGMPNGASVGIQDSPAPETLSLSSVVWKGKIFAYMTYGRHLFENVGSDGEYKYFIAEWDESEMEKVKYDDVVEITGTTDGSCYWEYIENTDYKGCVPWISVDSIKRVGTDKDAKLPAMTCLASGICMPNE